MSGKNLIKEGRSLMNGSIKISAAILMLVMACVLVGCDGKESNEAPKSQENKSASPQTTEESIIPENFKDQTISNKIEQTIKPVVIIKTSMGDITVELDSKSSPITVANFLNYVKSGFYDGTIFHRVIKNFMIQGGGFTAEMEKKTTNAPIKNEANNGLGNYRGTIAMARTPDPDSATSQFFINHRDNNFSLDYSEKNAGYAVFGKVVEGMDVVDKIANVQTGSKMRLRDVPVETVSIITVEIIDSSKPKAVSEATAEPSQNQ